MASPTKKAVNGPNRPAPSLLPAFEPLSSSPQLPPIARPIKTASPTKKPLPTNYLPSAPTSSTLNPSSSPSRCPPLSRASSALAERAPLATVPSVELDHDGQITLMGRSSNSSHYQLSTNKLVSRVHIKARYLAADEDHVPRVFLECCGWNGVKIHCQGRAWELFKGDTFTSETVDADVMIDVQDARVLLKWPRTPLRALTPSDSEDTWDSEASPSQRHRTSALKSPVSPSPASQPVPIYEDETQAVAVVASPTVEPHVENDEENDPIISAFGTVGANLTGRLESLGHPLTNESPRSKDASKAGSEDRVCKKHRRPLDAIDESASPQNSRPAKRQRQETRSGVDLTGFVVSHLLYSHLSTTPLSVLFQHVQAHERAEGGETGTTQAGLESLLKNTACVGAVPREGKDAAGKALESEYYYIPERDEDPVRRAVVLDTGIGGRRGLRECRKSHKVCDDLTAADDSNTTGASPSSRPIITSRSIHPRDQIVLVQRPDTHQ